MDKQIYREYKTIDQFLQKAYPADIADYIMQLEKEEREDFLNKRSSQLNLAEIIGYLDEEAQYHLARVLPEKDLSDILTKMHADDAADFLAEMPVGKVKKALNLMKEQKASELQRLLGYKEESAGGIMTTEYLAFYEDHTAGKVLEKLRKISPRAEMIYYIYVISRKKELLGVLSVRQLLRAEPDVKLQDVMSSKVIKVEVDRDQEEVARLLAKYDLLAVPVVNKRNQLMGIITVDDVIDVIEEEATEDIYKMAATGDIQTGGILKAVKKRIPWLLILLVGDLLSGLVIRNFEHSLEMIVALAFFIPVLMDMGGNVGTQSLTVVVRGLATGELSSLNFWKHLWQELRVGFIMALVLGLLLSIVAIIWQGNPSLGFVVGISMFITLLTAVAAGTSIPFIIQALGADPAVAAGPFITTLIDISGLFIYFTMATLLMEKLM